MGVETSLTYLAPCVESSLRRNGRVFTRRDRDGSDDIYHGAVTEVREVVVGDARRLEGPERRTIERHGFELVRRPLRFSYRNFFAQRQVVRDYYPECAEIVRQAMGATRVFAFDHNIRWASGKGSGKRIAGGQQVQAPIHFVHGDYTLESAPRRLRDLASPPGINDTLSSVLDEGASLLDAGLVSRVLDQRQRFALVNVWRNIDHTPVMRDPLAVCDGQSVESGDLVVFEIHYSDRVGENYFAKYAPRHEWWYYPHMTRDEVLLIKQWDSAGPLARTGGERSDSDVEEVGAPCTFSFHSAFTDPAGDLEAPERQSIEVRCVVFFD